jgi:(1->4)-alpha-D-glucan 1-alpha-D-glucosylmutase
MFVVYTLLSFRKEHGALFSQGDYNPLRPIGDKAEHLVAFSRRISADEVVVIAPRLFVGLTGGEERPPLGSAVWGNTALALSSGRYYDLFTGQVHDAQEQVELAAILRRFPVALLVRSSSSV